MPDLPRNGDRDAIHAVVDSPEYRHADQERRRTLAENHEKQNRAKALASGRPINFRRDKVRGDPTDY